MKLLGFLLLCHGVGALGSFSTIRALKEWYPSLRKPPFNPPNWVFGPVWTLIYTLMAIAASRICHDPRCLEVFLWQLLFNGLWSPLFFGLRSPALALVDVLFMLAAIARCIHVFALVDPLAAALFVPYQAWVVFAATLNFEIWRLNRGYLSS